MTKEEILKEAICKDHPEWLGDNPHIIENILQAMSEYAEQEAVAFGEWLDRKTATRQLGFISDWNKWRVWPETEIHMVHKEDFITTSQLFQIFKSQQNASDTDKSS